MSTQPRERSDIRIRQERAVLAAVHLPDSRFDPRDPLGELRSLARTAGATPVGEVIQNRSTPDSGSYMGRGKLDELRVMCNELDAEVVIFDHELSPRQIANVEEAVRRKVIDRSELILDIFASRAATLQAKLSVELAQLEYTYPRLRAMWSHLERIVGRGGIGGVGTRGPGEQQIEIDRRLVNRRKQQLRAQLEQIHQRKRREVSNRKNEHFTVGLVGYTNAGKSTLFNTLTAGGAHANDQLFATLVTRTREWQLGEGMSALLSDTVGFVRDLPHHLIASFRATLEEATHADLLLIVLDASDPAADLHYETVMSTLDDLFDEVRQREHEGDEQYQPPQRLLLLNKADRLVDNSSMLVWQRRVPGSIPICALREDSPGLAELRQRVREHMAGPERDVWITLPLSDSRRVHQIEQRGDVMAREYDEGAVRMRVRIGARLLDQLAAGDSGLEVESDGRGGNGRDVPPLRGGGRSA